MTSSKLHIQALCVLGVLGGSLQAAEKVTFQDHVQPIFREHCAACHSQGDASSGLALDDYGATLAGGAGGEVLEAGDPDGSRLWLLVTHAEAPEMPPGDKLPADQLEVIKKWIEGGLLDNAGSKPKKAKKSSIAQVEVTTDNRPVGEPAMPEGWFREPVVTSDRVGPVTSLAASPWAPVVAVPWQHQVSLYHAGDLQLLGVLPYPDGSPNVVRFSRDGSLLLVAGGVDAKVGSAAVFDVETGERLVTVGDELDAVLAADISPDRSLVAIGGPKKKVRVYRTSDAELVYEVGKHTDWVTALEFSPDGKLLATGDRNSGLLVWQASSGNPRADLRGHKKGVTDVAWRSDSQVIASSDEAGEVRLWRRDGQPIRNFKAHGEGAMAVDFASDGRLATAGRDRKVTVWNAKGKPQKQLGPMPEIALDAVFTAEDKSLVASDFGGAVQAFDPESGKQVGELAPNPPTLAARLATAEARRQRIDGKLKPALEKLAAAEKNFKEADEEHAAFAERLAGAQTKVDAAKKEKQAVQKQLNQREQTVAARQKAAAAATEVRKAAEQALSTVEKQLVEAGESEDSSSNQVVESLSNAVAQSKQIEQSKSGEVSAANKELASAKMSAESAGAALVGAEKLLAKVSSQRDGLADLDSARARVDKATAEVDALNKEFANADGLVASLSAERERLEQAMDDWARQAEELAAERERLAKQSAAQAERVAAAQQAVAAEQQKVDELAAQLAKLQEQLSAKRSAMNDAEGKAGELAAAAEDLAQKLADAETAAARAEARRAEFVAAEAMREKYLPGE